MVSQKPAFARASKWAVDLEYGRVGGQYDHHSVCHLYMSCGVVTTMASCARVCSMHKACVNKACALLQRLVVALAKKHYDASAKAPG